MNTNTANLLYWFTIEPYVFVGISSTTVLLYNTLDGNVVESQNSTVLRLMRNLLMKENNGVVGITKEEYSNEGINGFISLVRKYYMVDLIETSLSKSKPIQILPYCYIYYFGFLWDLCYLLYFLSGFPDVCSLAISFAARLRAGVIFYSVCRRKSSW